MTAFPKPTPQRLEDAATASATVLTDKAAALADKAGAQITRAIDGAEEAARSVYEQGRDASERVNEVAGNMKSAVDKSLKDQPMATLAVAAAVGFVIGALWKS